MQSVSRVCTNYPAADINLYDAPESILKDFRALPKNFDEAVSAVRASDFISDTLPGTTIEAYINNKTKV